MALTETIAPPALVFARNQIPLRLTTDALYSTAGVICLREITFTAPDTVDDKLELDWTDGTLTFALDFVFKTSPVAANYEIARYTGASTPEYITWITDVLVPGLMAHPSVNEYFSIQYFTSGGNNGISIQARRAFTTALTTTATGFTITSITNTSGVTAVKRDYFSIAVRVLVQDSVDDTLHNYRRLAEVYLAPSATGVADIDVQPYIHAYFRRAELQALPNSSGYVRLTKLKRKMYVEYSELYGDPVAQQPIKRTAQSTVLAGGVAPHDFVGIRSDIEAWLKQGTGAGLRFLTNRKKRTHYGEQQDWLSFFQVHSPASPLTLRVTRYYEDGTGTTNSSHNLPNYTTLIQDEAYAFGSNAKTLGVGVIPTNTVAYDLVLRDTGITYQSETIHIKRAPMPTGLTVLEYQNAYCAMETIGLPWSRQRILEVQRLYFEKAHGLNYLVSDAQRESLDEVLLQRFELRTDLAQDFDAAHLAELLASPQVYLHSFGPGSTITRIPCTLSAGSFNLELQNHAGQAIPNQSITVNLDRALSFSRIINLSNLCE